MLCPRYCTLPCDSAASVSDKTAAPATLTKRGHEADDATGSKTALVPACMTDDAQKYQVPARISSQEKQHRVQSASISHVLCE